jgi:hypothetical protein
MKFSRRLERPASNPSLSRTSPGFSATWQRLLTTDYTDFTDQNPHLSVSSVQSVVKRFGFFFAFPSRLRAFAVSALCVPDKHCAAGTLRRWDKNATDFSFQAEP